MPARSVSPLQPAAQCRQSPVLAPPQQLASTAASSLNVPGANSRQRPSPSVPPLPLQRMLGCQPDRTSSPPAAPYRPVLPGAISPTSSPISTVVSAVSSPMAMPTMSLSSAAVPRQRFSSASPAPVLFRSAVDMAKVATQHVHASVACANHSRSSPMIAARSRTASASPLGVATRSVPIRTASPTPSPTPGPAPVPQAPLRGGVVTSRTPTFHIGTGPVQQRPTGTNCQASRPIWPSMQTSPSDPHLTRWPARGGATGGSQTPLRVRFSPTKASAAPSSKGTACADGSFKARLDDAVDRFMAMQDLHDL